LVAIASLAGAYGMLLLAVRFSADRFIFFPEVDRSSDWALPPNAEEVHFGEPRLHAWFLEAPNAGRTVLVAHGNAGDIAGRKRVFERLRSLGVNVLAFDYRGYGRSRGRPTESGLYADTKAAFDYLVRVKQMDPKSIVVMGQSLGTAAASHVAAERECGGLILEAPMASAQAMASEILPFPPVGWALPVRLDNVRHLQRVRCPVLVVHGTRDAVIPLSHGEAVYASAREPKTFVPLPGAGHDDLWGEDRAAYLEAIRRFLESLNDEGARGPDRE
jgi:uncharacterized protein